MGFFGGRSKGFEARAEHNWSAISLDDFKNKSCLPPFAYGYLYFSILISLAVYGVDLFTAINLLAFNNWSSEIKPTKDIQLYAKWIFSVCIILSIINLIYEHIRARRIMNRGSVAECYLDNLAVRLESLRMGRGKGWKRFLVFTELTKSKKGSEYVMLFTYFQFQSWFRVVICSGPRQVVNGITLYSVWNNQFLNGGGNRLDGSSAENALKSFFSKLQFLAEKDIQQVLILSGMIFTAFIWIFSALALLLAVLCYILYVWHNVPKGQGGLSGYCGRKVNKRLTKIVRKKLDKAMQEEERQRNKMAYKMAKKNGEKPAFERQATLPSFATQTASIAASDDSLPQMPTMDDRKGSITSLPAYSAGPGTGPQGGASFELDAFDQKRPLPPTRTNTSLTNMSTSSRAPLMGGASDFGYGRTNSPAPSLPSIDLNNYPPVRPGTASSNRSVRRGPGQGSIGSTREYNPPFGGGSSAPNGGGGSQRNGSGSADYNGGRESPFPAPLQPSRSATQDSYGSSRGPPPRGPPPARPTYGGGRSATQDDYFSGPWSGNGSDSGRDRMGAPLPPTYARSVTNPSPGPRGPGGPGYPPQRNMTAPLPQQQQPRLPGGDYMGRSPTSQSNRGYGGGGYGPNDLESGRGGPRY